MTESSNISVIGTEVKVYNLRQFLADMAAAKKAVDALLGAGGSRRLNVQVNADTKTALQSLQAAQNVVSTLNNAQVDIGVTANTTAAQQAVDALNLALSGIDPSINVVITVAASAAQQIVDSLNLALNSLPPRKDITISIVAPNSGSVTQLATDLAALTGPVNITLQLAGTALADIQRIIGILSALSTPTTLSLAFDEGGALATIAQIRQALNDLSRQTDLRLTLDDAGSYALISDIGQALAALPPLTDLRLTLTDNGAAALATTVRDALTTISATTTLQLILDDQTDVAGVVAGINANLLSIATTAQTQLSLNVVTTGAEEAILRVQALLAGISGGSAGIIVNGEGSGALGLIAQVRNELQKLNNASANVAVRVALGNALAELQTLQSAIRLLSDREVALGVTAVLSGVDTALVAYRELTDKSVTWRVVTDVPDLGALSQAALQIIDKSATWTVEAKATGFDGLSTALAALDRYDSSPRQLIIGSNIAELGTAIANIDTRLLLLRDSKIELSVTANIQPALDAVARLQATITAAPVALLSDTQQALSQITVRPVVQLDAAQATQDAQALSSSLSAKVTIAPELDSTPAIQAAGEIKAAVDAIGATPINLTATLVDTATVALGELQKLIDSIKGQTITINVAANLSDAAQGLTEVARLAAQSDTSNSITLNLITTGILDNIAQIKLALDGLIGSRDVVVYANVANALADITSVQTALNDIRGRQSTVRVLANATAALEAIGQVETILMGLSGRQVSVTVAADALAATAALTELERLLQSASRTVTITATAQTAEATGLVTALTTAISGVTETLAVRVTVDDGGSVQTLTDLTKLTTDFPSGTLTVKIEVSAADAEGVIAKLAQALKDLPALTSVKITIDTADAQAAVDGLSKAIDGLAAKAINITANADLRDAIQQAEALVKAAMDLVDKRVTIEAQVIGDANAFSSLVSAAATAGEQAGSAFSDNVKAGVQLSLGNFLFNVAKNTVGGVIGAGVDTFKGAGAFQQVIANTSSLVSASTDPIPQAEAEARIRELLTLVANSTSLVASEDTAGAALNQLIRGGNTLAAAEGETEQTSLLREVVRLQNATGTTNTTQEFELAADTLSTIIKQNANARPENVLTPAEIVGLIIGLTTQSKVNSLTDVQYGLNNFATSANTLGISLGDQVALLAATSTFYKNTREQATAIDTLFTNLANPTGPQQEALNKLNVSAFNAAGAFAGLDELKRQAERVTSSGLSDKDLLALVGQAFGPVGAQAFLALGGSQKTIQQTRTEIEAVDVDEVLRIRTQTAQVAFENATGIVDTGLRKIFNDTIASLYPTIIEFGKFFGTLAPVFDEVGKRFSAFLAPFQASLQNLFQGSGNAVNESVASFVAGDGRKLQETFGTIFSGVLAVIDSFGGRVLTSIGAIFGYNMEFDTFSGAVRTAYDELLKLLDPVFLFAKNVNQVFERLNSLLGRFFDEAGNLDLLGAIFGRKGQEPTKVAETVNQIAGVNTETGQSAPGAIEPDERAENLILDGFKGVYQLLTRATSPAEPTIQGQRNVEATIGPAAPLNPPTTVTQKRPEDVTSEVIRSGFSQVGDFFRNIFTQIDAGVRANAEANKDATIVMMGAADTVGEQPPIKVEIVTPSGGGSGGYSNSGTVPEAGGGGSRGFGEGNQFFDPQDLFGAKAQSEEAFFKVADLFRGATDTVTVAAQSTAQSAQENAAISSGAAGQVAETAGQIAGASSTTAGALVTLTGALLSAASTITGAAGGVARSVASAASSIQNAAFNATQSIVQQASLRATTGVVAPQASTTVQSVSTVRTPVAPRQIVQPTTAAQVANAPRQVAQAPVNTSQRVSVASAQRQLTENTTNNTSAPAIIINVPPSENNYLFAGQRKSAQDTFAAAKPELDLPPTPLFVNPFAGYVAQQQNVQPTSAAQVADAPQRSRPASEEVTQLFRNVATELRQILPEQPERTVEIVQAQTEPAIIAQSPVAPVAPTILPAGSRPAEAGVTQFFQNITQAANAALTGTLGDRTPLAMPTVNPANRQSAVPATLMSPALERAGVTPTPPLAPDLSPALAAQLAQQEKIARNTGSVVQPTTDLLNATRENGSAQRVSLAELNSILSGIEGVFSPSKVTEADVAATAAGTYQNKPDEFLRRFQAQVNGGGAEFGDLAGQARGALENVGIQAASDIGGVFKQISDAWTSGVLFSADENLSLIDVAAVQQQLNLKAAGEATAATLAAQAEEGRANLTEYLAGVLDLSAVGVDSTAKTAEKTAPEANDEAADATGSLATSASTAAGELSTAGSSASSLADAFNGVIGRVIEAFDGLVKSIGDTVASINAALLKLGTATPAETPEAPLANARGTRFSPGGKTLVGEEGQELLYDPNRGTARLIGTMGPQIIDVPRGAGVYTAGETKEILHRSMMTVEDEVFGSAAKGIKPALGDLLNRPSSGPTTATTPSRPRLPAAPNVSRPSVSVPGLGATIGFSDRTERRQDPSPISASDRADFIDLTTLLGGFDTLSDLLNGATRRSAAQNSQRAMVSTFTNSYGGTVNPPSSNQTTIINDNRSYVTTNSTSNSQQITSNRRPDDLLRNLSFLEALA